MDFNELCSQELVDSIFVPLKTQNPNLKEDIEEIEFLFKNCCYNFNRIREEIIRSNQGFDKSMDSQKEEVLKKFPIKEMKIPITLWQDIIVFEFQSFLTNVMRTINFLVKFNIKNKENKILKNYPTIWAFLYGEHSDEYKKYYFYPELKKSYIKWIEEIKKLRDKVTHRYLIKKMVGFLVFKWERSNEEIKPEGETIVGIHEYNIDNIEIYCNEKLRKLGDLIKNYFII